MGYSERVKHFANPEFLPEGWFWLSKSAALQKKALIPVTFWGQDLALYRGEDGIARAVEAYCPHMGAHLCDGKVEGASVRCPFHYWKFNESGACEEIPCQQD